MKKLFVSHIALDADFADALKKWIELAFKRGVQSAVLTGLSRVVFTCRNTIRLREAQSKTEKFLATIAGGCK